MVMATAYGGPDVLSLVEDAVAEPGRGEVTIQVKAAGVNPFDHLFYSGAFGSDEDSLPLRVGQELSGVVTRAGPEAIGLAGPIQIGDEVIAYRPDVLGAYATEITCPANIVAPKPAALSWEQASGLLFAGAAAVHALAATGVKEGDTALIHGVSGGVGLIAAQLALLRGARVIGTASATRHESLRKLGVDPVGYGRGLTERVLDLAPGKVDSAIDAAGTDEAIDASLALVSDKTRIATIVAFQRGPRSESRHSAAPGVPPMPAPTSALRHGRNLSHWPPTGKWSL